MLLTGKLPFPGATPEHSMLMRLNEPPRSLSSVSMGIAWPPAVQGVLDRVLAREPEARFATAGEFAAAFGQAVAGPVPSPRQDVPSPRLDAPPWRRMSRVAAVIAAALVLGVGLVLGSRRHESRVEPSPGPAQDSAESGLMDSVGERQAVGREGGGSAPDTVGQPGGDVLRDSIPRCPCLRGHATGAHLRIRRRRGPATAGPAGTTRTHEPWKPAPPPTPSAPWQCEHTARSIRVHPARRTAAGFGPPGPVSARLDPAASQDPAGQRGRRDLQGRGARARRGG